MPGSGWARCPGTCGEWIQGAKSGEPFLVDCPVDRYSEVSVELTSLGWNIPLHKTKVNKALQILSLEKNIKQYGIFQFNKEIPIGKGMASSTADIVSATAAFLAALGERPTDKQLARIALNVEPSDSVMFPGITEISHVYGNYHKVLGPVVPAKFLALDWGGEVDTLRFNARIDLSAHYRKHEPEILKAFELIEEGILNADLEKMAMGGKISATCNLEINPKPYFKEFSFWVRERAGLGIITAHSGTLLAGVFPPGMDLEKLKADAVERFSPVFIELLSAQNGGVEFHGR